MGGRSLPHAVLMMIPEAWENHAEMDPARRAFYEFHAALMEPWDGPACITFTDGALIGAVLDRNGLRPARYWVTEDGLVVLASEVGVLDLDPSTVVRKGRLQPGRMFLVDTDRGRIVDDAEIKAELAAEAPYDEWLHAGQFHLGDLPDREHVVHSRASVTRRQQTFGYTEEELRLLLNPMAQAGAEPIGSMGTDTPIAVLSQRPRLLFDYFSQLFAQVTNPPLDAIREELVTSLGTAIGPDQNVLTATPAHCRQMALSFPVIDNDELAKIVHINHDGDLPGFAASRIRGLYPVAGGGAALQARLEEIFAEVSAAIADGARFIVLSDRDSDAELAPIPSLLLTSAVHHHLIRERTRTQVGLIVEAGDVREVHHVALLIGYGASAVNPYLAMETVEDLAVHGLVPGVDPTRPDLAVRHLIKALGKGVLKVMSKMGISTVASYHGAQVFEAVGLDQALVDRYFTGTTSVLGGVGLDVLADEVAARHRTAYPSRRSAHRPPHARRRWRVPVAPRGRAAPVQPRDGVPAPARHPHPPLRHLQAVHPRGRRAGRAADDAARPVPVQGCGGRRRPPAGPDRGGRTGRRDRQAVLHRRHVLRLDLAGGARDARHRDEPDRRQVEHRRGRRGPRPAVRRAALRGEAGRQRPVRRHQRVPRQRRRPADQDGAGRQAGRGRPAARSQGLSLDREDPALHARRRADLAAAAPRHLLDRGSHPADPRPQERQQPRAGARQARRRGRRRHRRGRCQQGARRRRPHLRPRRRHRCVTADQPQARRCAVGARPGRDPADPAAQRVAGPDRRAGRRPDQDRPRRRDRRAARCRGVRLRDRAARRQRLHHDAGLPPRHLPGRHRDAEPRAAQEVHRQAGVRRDVLRLHRRGGSRAPGRAGLPQRRGGGRARRGARHQRRGRALEGQRPRPGADPARSRPARRQRRAAAARRRTTGWRRRWTTS